MQKQNNIIPIPKKNRNLNNLKNNPNILEESMDNFNSTNQGTLDARKKILSLENLNLIFYYHDLIMNKDLDFYMKKREKPFASIKLEKNECLIMAWIDPLPIMERCLRDAREAVFAYHKVSKERIPMAEVYYQEEIKEHVKASYEYLVQAAIITYFNSQQLEKALWAIGYTSTQEVSDIINIGFDYKSKQL